MNSPRKIADRAIHAHLTAVRDTVISTALFMGAFYLLRLRASSEHFGWVDGVIVGTLVVAGLAIGYRDRLALVAGAASKVWRKRD